MALLNSYYLPDLYVEDHSIDVPLDWRGTSPARLAGEKDAAASETPLVSGMAAQKPDSLFAGKGLKIFYRTVCAPENKDKDLPLLVFLQGGPGGMGPRLLSPTSDGWVAEAVKHFRVILPDQRGTGRSSHVDGSVMKRLAAEAPALGRDAARLQADYLKRLLAPSIVRDFEYLRLTEFGGRRWALLGQSYGGFCTLAYLSAFPEAVTAAFTCGGVPPVGYEAKDVYAHSFPRMARKTQGWYARYPEDEKRVSLIADRLSAGDVKLPDGAPFTVSRLQAAGAGLGMKPAPERLHNLLDTAFVAGDGTADAALAAAGGDPSKVGLTTGFLSNVMDLTSTPTNPLYWTLQEFIYADGELEKPIDWAAAHEAASRPEFATTARPLMFFAEAMFPWMFEEDPALVPFKDAMDVLMRDTVFDKVYDQDVLSQNPVPLYSAVYFEDAYVDSGLQLDVLSRTGNAHPWVTNEFEHDGLHGSFVLPHLLAEADSHGDLAAVYES